MFRLMDKRGRTYYKPEDRSCNDIDQIVINMSFYDWIDAYEDPLCRDRDKVLVKSDEIYLVSREED